MTELDHPHDAKCADRRCSECGARLSRYAPTGSSYCAACEPARISHDSYMDAVARAMGEIPTTCKRGHDLDLSTRTDVRDGGRRVTRICGECKRERDAAYARARRAAK